MNLHSLVGALPRKRGAIHTLERGKPVRHPYSKLADDVAAARDRLRGWGVSCTPAWAFTPPIPILGWSTTWP